MPLTSGVVCGEHPLDELDCSIATNIQKTCHTTSLPEELLFSTCQNCQKYTQGLQPLQNALLMTVLEWFMVNEHTSSMSASAQMMRGFLPPHSRLVDFMVLDASARISFPTAVLPVKPICNTRLVNQGFPCTYVYRQHSKSRKMCRGRQLSLMCSNLHATRPLTCG